MQDAALIAIVLSGLLVVAWLIKTMYAKHLERRYGPKLWQLEEHSDGELLSVFAVCPGEQSFLIGSAAWAARDFDERIAEIRLEGQLKVQTLNEGLVTQRLPR